MSEESIAIALYDYKAHEKEELSIKKNDKLVIVDDSQTWWKVRNDQNVEGYVPSNYVGRKDAMKKTKIKQFFKKDKKKSSSDTNGYDNDSNQYCTPESVMTPQKTLCIVKAKFSYQPIHVDELQLTKGDLIHVLEKEGDGWWKGFIGTRQGWFPSNYAEDQITELESVPLLKVITLYQFQSPNSEELNFEKGEVLDVIKQPDGDPDWWFAKKQDGSKGLVPKNYVKPVSDEQPTTPTQRRFPNEISDKIPVPQTETSLSFERKILPSHQGLPFVNQEWFWGRISRRQGEQLLLNHGTDGDFLVRESETTSGDYSISLKAPDRIKHFRVQSQDTSGFKIGQRTFITIDLLIEHYKKSPIFTNEKGEKIYLIKPVDLRSLIHGITTK